MREFNRLRVYAKFSLYIGRVQLRVGRMEVIFSEFRFVSIIFHPFADIRKGFTNEMPSIKSRQWLKGEFNNWNFGGSNAESE